MVVVVNRAAGCAGLVRERRAAAPVPRLLSHTWFAGLKQSDGVGR